MTDIDVIAHTGTGATADVTTNNGSADFDPTVYITKQRGNGSVGGVFKTSTMAAADCCLATATVKNTATMVTLGTGKVTLSSAAGVNTSGQVHNSLAIRHDGSSCNVGTYTGNGSDPQTIDTGIARKAVMIVSEAATEGRFYTQYMADNGYNAKGMAAAATAAVIAWSGATSMNVSGAMNTNSEVYHWIAFDNITDMFEAIGYQGNGSDNRDISLVDIAGTPESVIVAICNDAGTTARFCRFWGPGQGDSASIFDTFGSSANTIQGAGAGTFQVGTDATVNANTGQNFAAMVFVTGTDAGGGGGDPEGNLVGGKLLGGGLLVKGVLVG